MTKSYPRHKVICTCKVSLTFCAAVDFVAIEIGKILETLSISIANPTVGKGVIYGHESYHSPKEVLPRGRDNGDG